MKVSELGEFGLIELLQEMVGPPRGDIIIGIGDDAAAWHTDASIQLATTDALIEDVHFTLGTTSWRELGWKALAVNLSDIAAMGGVPKYALISLGLPGHTEVDDVADLYRGMMDLARLFRVTIIGGDVTAAPLVALAVMVNGTGRKLLTRSNAIAGDCIAVTGFLGASAAGLTLLRKELGLELEPHVANTLRQAHVKPMPRVAEGQILARQGVKSAMDISDGLFIDLEKLCKASGVSARIKANAIPIHPMVRRVFEAEALEFALSGGEDYELLFTASAEVLARIRDSIDCPVTTIGEITPGERGQVRLVDALGKEITLRRHGWEHFAPHNTDEDN